ncbi:MAG: KamA family radical SAM protein [Candidatus Firestonebacteria bacterium]
MEKWQILVKDSVINEEQLAKHILINKSDIRKVRNKYPMRIPHYYLNIIRNSALKLQAIPDIKELNDTKGYIDPLNEEGDSPVSNLTHRYPDRVLFLISGKCAMYCRFCTRKRKVGTKIIINNATINKGINYIKSHTQIRDVILSGGDPLMLTDIKLEEIIEKLRNIKHIEIIRIGTRIPCVLPQRITKKLCKMLKKYHPIYINTHFNHPDEITEESKKACEMLADNGIPLGNQTVLLKGINDSKEIINELMRKLLTLRVKPYYLYQADLCRGTSHFKTKVETGLEIISALRGYISGIAVPNYVIDAPHGGGKIIISPENIVKTTNKGFILKNYQGKYYKYPR